MQGMHEPRFTDIGSVVDDLRSVGYLADESIATVVYLADRLDRPLLVEGPAGAGKTELAKTVAAMLSHQLVRLQCYEGVDETKTLYEWNYKKQLLRIQAGKDEAWDAMSDDIFSEEFLLERPVLKAIRSSDPVVLLIDEVDKLDLEAEALLLEVLSDWQVTIHEMGTVTATSCRSLC
jgi:MoxR-like ATPase